MKKTKKLLPITLFLLSILFIVTSCDNDSDPSPNDNQCNYQGLTYVDSSNNINTQIPESELQTDYFSSGPNVEVWDTTNPGATFIVTNALTVGAVDNNPQIKINDLNLTGVVTCQRAGNSVGDELRLDIVITGGAEVELCVVIDNAN